MSAEEPLDQYDLDRAAIRQILDEHSVVGSRTEGDDFRIMVCRCGESYKWGHALDHLADVLADLWPSTPETDRTPREPSVIPSRTTDPGTSKDAARAIVVRAGSQRAYLLEAFGELRSDGVTDEEAAAYHRHVSLASEYAKRCSELREALLIEPTGETRPGSSGQQRIVSRITPDGRRWLQQNRA